MKKLLLVILLLLSSSPVYSYDWSQDPNAVAVWTFAEGSGTLTDHSSNSNTGTLTDGAVWAAMAGTGAPSYANYMVTCDGVNDYINVANHASLVFGTDSFSGVHWIRAVASPGDLYPSFIGKGDTGNGEWMYRVDTTNSGKVKFYGDAGQVQMVGYGVDLTDNEWHHAAFTLNTLGNSGILYVDGVKESDVEQSTNGADLTDTSDLRLGSADGDTNRFWDGHLSETALFDGVLSPTDINDIMDNGLVQAVAGRTRRMFVVQ